MLNMCVLKVPYFRVFMRFQQLIKPGFVDVFDYTVATWLKNCRLLFSSMACDENTQLFNRQTSFRCSYNSKLNVADGYYF